MGFTTPDLPLESIGVAGSWGPLAGLRDKVVFIAARSEQYIPALVFFALYPFVDMIVAAKLLIVTLWVGAAFSKLGRHFANVIPPMASNTPWVNMKAVKRLHYRSHPEDLRLAPAHGAGTLVEMGTPFLLLFSQSHALTVPGVVLMLAFHTFSISTFPPAVPLEWVMDAAVGFVERGSWAVKDAVAVQPWLPNGPIPTQVEWRPAGYARVSHARVEVPA